jgi:hypothetical protein
VEPVHQTVDLTNISEQQQLIQLQKEFYNHAKTAQVLVLHGLLLFNLISILILIFKQK